MNKADTYSPRTTERVLHAVRQALGLAVVEPVGFGLPPGAVLYRRAGLVIAGTSCAFSLFKEPMMTAAHDLGADILLARHGAHPEVLNPVPWDAIVWSSKSPFSLKDLFLFEGRSGDTWLVEGGDGPCLHVTPSGLRLVMVPTFTRSELHQGMCRAAKRIVQRATQGSN